MRSIFRLYLRVVSPLRTVLKEPKSFRYYDLPPLWRAYGDVLSLYETRFNISTPYPVQEAVLRVAENLLFDDY